MKQKTAAKEDANFPEDELAGEDALRALEKFSSHGGLLSREDIDEILREDTRGL